MRTIAMLPVRNDAWVLPHSLACLSGFCDHILVGDRQSDDELRAICARFPKVAVIDAPVSSAPSVRNLRFVAAPSAIATWFWS